MLPGTTFLLHRCLSTNMAVQTKGGYGHDERHGEREISADRLVGVAKLNARLAVNLQSLQATSSSPGTEIPASPIQSAVQHVLEGSAQLCEMLDAITASPDDRLEIFPSFRSSSASPASQGSSPQGCEMLLLASYITAYILLTRSWREIYMHLHRTLLPGRHHEPREGTQSGPAIFMPSLRLEQPLDAGCPDRRGDV